MDLGDKVKEKIDDIGPMLKQVVEPIKKMWKDVGKDVRMDKVEIEIAIGFEVSSGFILVGSKGNANLKVKLSLTRDIPEA